MPDFRPVQAVLGILLVLLAALMLIPALTGSLGGEPDFVIFLASSAVTGFVGVALWLTGRQDEPATLTIRQTFLLTTLAWGVSAAFAALPFVWGRSNLSYPAAYFEAVSGLTTTGGTAIVGLDQMASSILLWRSLLHFYGGIGIIVIAVAVLPMLQIGGMQLFRTESSDKSEKLFPRAAEIASATFGVYLALNLACMIAFMAAGVPAFDAANLAMSTIATGGMAPSDSSLGLYKSAAVDWVAIVFMLSGAVPLLLFVKMAFGRDVFALVRSPEVRAFFAIILAFSVVLWAYQEIAGLHSGHDAIRYAVFNVVTLITTTGFATVDYTNWGAFSDVLLFVVTFLGGCTGSTSGGIKAFRLVVLYEALKQQLRRMRFPNGVFAATYAGKRLDDEVISSVVSFVVLYVITFLAAGLLLNLSGMDFTTAFSASIANLANAGPGLGAKIGPAGNYAELSAFQYWVLSATMLIGRLEIVTVFVIFLPHFWRR